MAGKVKAFLDDFAASVPRVKTEVHATIEGFMRR
jgi:hypothetical protein